LAGGEHFSSMAHSLPPRRGTSFKQRPKHNKRLCLFRALPLAGGDAFFQRGGFYAATPWQGVQATPQAQLVVPVSGASIGGR
jgi:hypothetical protein